MFYKFYISSGKKVIIVILDDFFSDLSKKGDEKWLKDSSAVISINHREENVRL